jgi:hypothetical protein
LRAPTICQDTAAGIPQQIAAARGTIAAQVRKASVSDQNRQPACRGRAPIVRRAVSQLCRHPRARFRWPPPIADGDASRDQVVGIWTVLRELTRLSFMVVLGEQSTYDLREI